MFRSVQVTREHQGLWLSTASIVSVLTFILFIVVFVG
jgi:hypothetical protein